MGGQTTILKSGKPLTPEQQFFKNKRATLRMNGETKSLSVPIEKPTDKPENREKPTIKKIPTPEIRPGFDGQEWLNQSIDLINNQNTSGANNQANQAIIPSLNRAKQNTNNRGAQQSAQVRENLLQNTRGGQQSALARKNRVRNTRGGQQSARAKSNAQVKYPDVPPTRRSITQSNNLASNGRGGGQPPKFERFSKQPIGLGKGTVPKTKPLFESELMTALVKIGMRKTDENFTEADKREIMIDILTKQALVKFIGTNANDAKRYAVQQYKKFKLKEDYFREQFKNPTDPLIFQIINTLDDYIGDEVAFVLALIVELTPLSAVRDLRVNLGEAFEFYQQGKPKEMGWALAKAGFAGLQLAPFSILFSVFGKAAVKLIKFAFKKDFTKTKNLIGQALSEPTSRIKVSKLDKAVAVSQFVAASTSKAIKKMMSNGASPEAVIKAFGVEVTSAVLKAASLKIGNTVKYGGKLSNRKMLDKLYKLKPGIKKDIVEYFKGIFGDIPGKAIEAAVNELVEEMFKRLSEDTEDQVR